MALSFSAKLMRGVSRCAALVTPKTAPTSCRYFSSAENSRVLVNLNDKTGVATMQLNRPPVNSLNLEVLTDMTIALDKLQTEKDCRGMILTSSSPGIFCAGLDIMEMYNPQEDRLREFWRTLQELWKMMYGSRLATIAAINGHSPAGGCLLSLTCDYRIMAQGKFTIGLNETLLGIVAPFWFQDTMVNTVGHRETERALQLGLLYSGENALKVGLIDELVSPEKVMETAEGQMQMWLKIPDFARQLTKEQLRGPTVQKLAQHQEADIDHFVNFITKKAIQKSLEMYLNMLKQKKK
ncbi:hypothetical protein CAPTEDRAFT_218894 [Capitella teleta]|uniref:Enoyl-CoA delta isomerase 1, mitochondrial n=1 Tax=Capitella teleta TaxID=283909 RepID=R7VD52_CAPTE|nr:hypothetical protein CAPTEDRAFT_218894 [Capitella teleta]|eukprot:ELU16502.1 hypothetical protein CAPTEDRAFT_218894 [Capitella teleta]